MRFLSKYYLLNKRPTLSRKADGGIISESLSAPLQITSLAYIIILLVFVCTAKLPVASVLVYLGGPDSQVQLVLDNININPAIGLFAERGPFETMVNVSVGRGSMDLVSGSTAEVYLTKIVCVPDGGVTICTSLRTRVRIFD